MPISSIIKINYYRQNNLLLVQSDEFERDLVCFQINEQELN